MDFTHRATRDHIERVADSQARNKQGLYEREGEKDLFQCLHCAGMTSKNLLLSERVLVLFELNRVVWNPAVALENVMVE